MVLCSDKLVFVSEDLTKKTNFGISSLFYFVSFICLTATFKALHCIVVNKAIHCVDKEGRILKARAICYIKPAEGLDLLLG